MQPNKILDSNKDIKNLGIQKFLRNAAPQHSNKLFNLFQVSLDIIYNNNFHQIRIGW